MTQTKLLAQTYRVIEYSDSLVFCTDWSPISRFSVRFFMPSAL